MSFMNGPHTHYSGALPGAVAEAGAMEQLKTWLTGYVDGKLEGYSPEVDTTKIKDEILTEVDKKIEAASVFKFSGGPDIVSKYNGITRHLTFDRGNDFDDYHTIDIQWGKFVRYLCLWIDFSDSTNSIALTDYIAADGKNIVYTDVKLTLAGNGTYFGSGCHTVPTSSYIMYIENNVLHVQQSNNIPNNVEVAMVEIKYVLVDP